MKNFLNIFYLSTSTTTSFSVFFSEMELEREKVNVEPNLMNKTDKKQSHFFSKNIYVVLQKPIAFY